MKKITLILLSLIVLTTYHLLLTTHCLYAASWPLFRASAQRSGALTERTEPNFTFPWNLQYGPDFSSSFHIMGGIVSSPVVYKDIVYFGGRDNSVWALDALTGAQVWQYSTDDWVDATPYVSADGVFVPCKDKYFYAFDRLTGALKWPPVYTGSMDCSSPVLYNEKLYFLSGNSGNPNNYLYVIDALSGQLLNSVPISQFGFSSPTIKNGLMFFGTNDGQFHCYDLSNYQVKWSTQTQGGIFYSTLAASDDAVYAVSGEDERRLFCFNPNNGNLLWQSARFSNSAILTSVSSVGLGENNVFVACSSGTSLFLYAFPLTGTSPVSPTWSVKIGLPHPAGIVSSPAIADGTVYIGSGDGKLYCLRASDGYFYDQDAGDYTGTPKGYQLSYDQSESNGIVSSPAIANGMVFVGTYDGQMYALKAAKVTTISYPDNSEAVVNQVQVLGTVIDNATPISSYSLQYAPGENPAPGDWKEVAAGTAAVDAGVLGTWNASGLEDDTYTLKLTVNGSAVNRALNRVTVDNPPLAPSNLRVEDTPFDGGGSLTLTWNRSGDDGSGDNDVANYKIYKSTYEGGFSYSAQVTNQTTSYIDSNCPAQTTYYFVVTAIDRLSESSYSNSAGAFSIADGVEILPAAGGTVTLNYNGTVTELIIEPNTFDQTVWVGIRVPDDPPNSGKPANSKDTNIVREFGLTPANAVFLKPVTIKLPYRAQEVTGMNKENLRIYWWDGLKMLWRIVNTSDALSEDGRVTARIPHFSLYRLMEYTAGMEELINDEKSYTYPNPAKEDKLYFKFYLGSKADVTIDVYNVAGELIAHLEKANCPAGIVSEQEWNIGSIASGVYIYRIEAKTPTASKAIKKKLAIIH